MGQRRVLSGSQTSLRKANIAEVLSTLQRFGGMTQIEISNSTNLSTATVSSIVRELNDLGMVETRSVTSNGRRALRVSLSADKGVVVGVAINAVTMDVVLGDRTGKVLTKKTMLLPYNHEPETTLIRASELVEDLLDLVGSDLNELHAVVLAVDAPIDLRGRVVVPDGVPGWLGWSGDSLRQYFSCRIAELVRVSEMAGLAHLHSELNGKPQDVIYIHADESISGAIFIGGLPVRGAHGMAGEFGHLPAIIDGVICSCGNRGCLNTVVGSRFLTGLLPPGSEQTTLADVLDAAKRNERGCMRLIEDTGRRVAEVLSPVVRSIDPAVVIVGGQMAAAEGVFYDSFKTELCATLPLVEQGETRVMCASGGEGMAALGAMMYASKLASEVS